jgi:hypothetical protein
MWEMKHSVKLFSPVYQQHEAGTKNEAYGIIGFW